jgi:CRP-like cAMP-binding protein
MPVLSVESLFAQSRLFAGLPAASREQLARATTQRTYTFGDLLFQRGDPGDALHVVVSGQIKVFIEADQEDEIVIAILGPGDFVGELSLLDGRPRSASVEALDTVETLVVPRSDFIAALRANPSVMETVVMALAARLRETNALAADIAALSRETFVPMDGTAADAHVAGTESAVTSG